MITENLSTLKIHKLTQEQYDRELEAGNIDGSALYLTPDTVEQELSDISANMSILRQDCERLDKDVSKLQSGINNSFQEHITENAEAGLRQIYEDMSSGSQFIEVSLPEEVYNVHLWKSDNNGVAEIESTNATSSRICRIKNGVWQEWEYKSPPMNLGVVYRTTEYYLGCPVYTQLVYSSIGSNPDPYPIQIPESIAVIRYSAVVVDAAGAVYADDSAIKSIFKGTINVDNSLQKDGIYVQIWFIDVSNENIFPSG